LFFQAEDGIRDFHVTGVQTCALPIFADELRINLAIPLTPAGKISRMDVLGGDNGGFPNGRRLGDDVVDIEEQAVAGFLKGKKVRSEERRVGKECRYGWWQGG